MTTQQDAAQVTVVLNDCAAQDADTVFRSLNTAFPATPGGAPGSPISTRQGGQTAWIESFDVSAEGPHSAARELTGPVTADLQGCPDAVRKVEHALGDSFSVAEHGLIHGDQEIDVQLRIESTRPR
ncbi:hypothetical protein ACFOSC_22525 [Streptantibioticus rubrisoli]|uniref:Uncharacterized protein n=1 Tax=Streptantibioticus rubrisoli TaxID=1387313 RepID=A0ABT1P5T6_9ACTN|nr:hypothetical protein [Streptantibioticus rubrisoli]MCQ4040736.1 hypothetical protein [Streptantibioticus rubrisoli]